jgi:hypothetical protein
VEVDFDDDKVVDDFVKVIVVKVEDLEDGE